MKNTIITQSHFLFFDLINFVGCFLVSFFDDGVTCGRGFLAMRLGCTLFTSVAFIADAFGLGLVT